MLLQTGQHQLRNYGKLSLQILLNGGIIEKIRYTYIHTYIHHIHITYYTFKIEIDKLVNIITQRSPKYPDFKHKDTGEALWVEGRYNPSWVKSQLSILDSRMESFQQQNPRSRSDSMFGDNLTPY